MSENTTSNFSLLVKLLRMTTSANDAEAIVSMRKANSVAEKFGGWEKILLERITIIEDPFEKLSRPTAGRATTGRTTTSNTSAPPRPHQQQTPPSSGFGTTAPPPQSSRPSPPQSTCLHCGNNFDSGRGYGRYMNEFCSLHCSAASTTRQQPRNRLKVRANRYAGHCYCCGSFVNANEGGFFNPSVHNLTAPDKYVVVCDSCDRNGTSVPSKAARKKTASTSSILNGL